MNWKTISVLLSCGDKITRPDWKPESYWVISKDGHERILCHDGTNAIVHLKQLEANDWKVWFKPRVKCFWCERYVVDLIKHTNEMHPYLSPRSYDFMKNRCQTC